MARPRLGDSERRRRTIGVRVTEAEAEELRERAPQAARLSMGAYLRRRGLGQRVRMVAERRLAAAERCRPRGARSVEWRITACTTGGCRGRGIRRARSGWPRSGGPRSEGRVGRWPRWPKGWSRTATASIDMTGGHALSAGEVPDEVIERCIAWAWLEGR